MDTEVKMRELLSSSVDATKDALNALRDIVTSDVESSAARIKAAVQITTILHKAIDNIELMERAKKIQDAVDKVADDNPYQPDIG